MRQAGFWAAVAGLALVADPLATLVADSKVVTTYFPGLKTLNDYRTKVNG
jgi:hypothetical protein